MWKSLLDNIGGWCEKHLTIPGVPWWVSILVISFAMAVLSILVTAIGVVCIPANYFQGDEPPPTIGHWHPVLRWIVRIIKNVVGWLLVVLGLITSLPTVPGQGLLTILLGLMLVEFPGKRRLEMRFVRQPRIRTAIDAIRVRFGAQPLLLGEDDPAAKS